ncbi:MAG: iron-sulfur cluster assembly scaffold protein [Planctomycetes bacterium]|nr:iron-sulfur cluster assembly scaffold protein [Planctomycetota bacterium]MCW8140191.1 iron-sulfur cluster assembly scaffold protein [Planctomycetota bacterium]
MDPFTDHFQSPRNVGDLARPDARVEVDNPVCGDRLTLALRVEGGRVVEVAWRVLGCSGAIAAASAMSEQVKGRDLAAAGAVDRDAIDRALGGLPALKRHGADLAAQGLRAALAALETHGGVE